MNRESLWMAHIHVLVPATLHISAYAFLDFSEALETPRTIVTLTWLLITAVLLGIHAALLHRRNHMLETLRLRNVRLLEGIGRVQSLFIAATHSPKLFEEMLDQLLKLSGSTYGFVGEILYGPEEQPYLKSLAFAYMTESSAKRIFFEHYNEDGREFHDLDTLFGAAVRTGKPVIANNPNSESDPIGFPPDHPTPRTFLGIPLYHRGEMIGMFGLADRKQGYDEMLLEYLDPFSTTCAGIIRAFRHERQHQHMEEIAVRFGNILDDSLQEIYVFDARTLKFEQVNRGACENLGYTPEELLRMRPIDLYPETSERRFQALIEPLRSGAQRKVEFTTFHRRKDESSYPVDVYLHLSTAPAPVFVAIVLDITERRRMEKEKAKLEAQIIQSQKLETIGTLAGGIAHDFNNILAPIIWYTEMIINDLDQSDEMHEELKHVLKAANRAKDLVQQILTFSRLKESKRQPVKIQFVIAEALKLLRASLPATIEFRQELDKNCEPIFADPTQIHQVVMNLCTNAFHAMRKGGGILELNLKMVTVSQDFAERNPAIKPGSAACLQVRDSGHGMDPATLSRIFEPFFTTKRVGEGTGLGLSVIHGIVMTHGGSITVDSKPGQGATFSVYLPTIDYDAQTTPQWQKNLSQGRETVLLVDDEEEITYSGKVMLERFGYQVTATTDCFEAIEWVRLDPDRFDLLITDQTMPGLTGLRLAEKIHALRQDLPIIIITGYSEDLTEDVWKGKGIGACVMKPMTGVQLHEAIRQVMDHRKLAQAQADAGYQE
jgi:PAS domain S-box-containing protein